MGLSGKKYYIAIFCCINSCSILRILQENDVPLLHRAAWKEFVSLLQKAFRDSCNRHLVLYHVKPNPTCSASARGAATPPLPTSPPHLPNPRTWKSNFLRHPRGIPTRGRSGSLPANPPRLDFRAQNFIFSSFQSQFLKLMMESVWRAH